MEKFVENEVVIYQNGNSFELGIVKRVCDNGDCFVWYHTGDTAARTSPCHLHKITNSYAFSITRLSCDSNSKESNIEKKLVAYANTIISDRCEWEGPSKVLLNLVEFGFTKDELIEMSFDAYAIDSALEYLGYTDNTEKGGE